MSNQAERVLFSGYKPEQQRMSTLYGRVLAEHKSPSHDKYHLDTTLTRARELFEWCANQGMPSNWELIFTGVCAHDLGRNDPTLHGQGSLQASVEKAKTILNTCGYTPAETDTICRIILSHDQPDLTPNNLEGLILKEADFLAGMGAWGIYRTIAWGIESNRSTEAIITALREKMPKRISSLQLPPSQEIAWKEWPLVILFLAQLESQSKHQEQEPRPGKYIVFEGISGSGKDTQGQFLANYFVAKDKEVIVLKEPSFLEINLLIMAKEEAQKSGRQITQLERALILAADRVAIAERIRKALESGQTVIGIRSLLSAMAYQGESPGGMAQILFLNHFVPQPDLVIYLEVTPKVALGRTYQRTAEKGTPPDDFEQEEKMVETQRHFRQALEMLPGTKIEIIPADPPKKEVFASILEVLEKYQFSKS